MLTSTAVALTVVHFVGSFCKYVRAEKLDTEQVRQHHELCTMLGLIALAVLWR